MFAIIEHAKPAAVVTYVVSASPTVILSMCVTPQEGGGFFQSHSNIASSCEATRQVPAGHKLKA